MLAEKIAEIELPQILESEGIELRRSGNGYQFRCCFHNDRHPSASLYIKGGRWRWKCFGCGEGGDAIDFIMKRNELDFKGACQYLGIESGPLSPIQKVEIQKNQTRRKISDIFKAWELSAIDELRNTIFSISLVSRKFKTVDDLEFYCGILEPLAGLQGTLDVLMTGSKADREGVYRRWKRRGNRFF